MFNVSISVDVNDDDEYRYTPLIMRLCLGMSGVRKRAQKIVFLVARLGYISPIGLKEPEIDFPLTCSIRTRYSTNQATAPGFRVK